MAQIHKYRAKIDRNPPEGGRARQKDPLSFFFSDDLKRWISGRSKKKAEPRF